MLKKVLQFVYQYFFYFHLLIIALFFYLLIFLIWHYVAPEILAHWFWPDSYFLFQLLLFLANFFFFTFLCQRRYLGFWLAVCIFSFLFFQFSHFIFTLPLILGLVISNVCFFLFLRIYQYLKIKT